MNADVEQSFQFAELTVSALKGVGLVATPRNYELWYTHIEGRNPALSRDIQKRLDAYGRVSQADANELYADHIQQAGFAQHVTEIVARFQTEITDVYDVIEQTGETAIDREETLAGLSNQLRQSTAEYPAVGALLEQVIGVAKDMKTQNTQLESRLAESSTEISTLQKNVESIQKEAMKDPLTGVANRAAFDRSILECIAVANATGDPMSLLLTDIDHFKSFNDQYGHQTGDQVLRLVAEVMNANVKGQDTLARYGGEEFAIVLPQTGLDNAEKLAERIRIAVGSRRLKKRRTDEDLGAVTISIGVAVLHSADSVESIVERADKCLYAAKDNGRDQVMTETCTIADPDQRSSGAA